MRVEVDFDEDVEEAGFCGVGDGRVGSDDGFVGLGVAETDHEVLAYGEAERLGGVLQFEGEDSGVP